MSDKLKIILSAVAIIAAGVFVISFILSPSDSEDFPDGGTWTKCSACQKTQVVDSEARGVFYDENPNMMGRPMVCPKCKKTVFILRQNRKATGRPFVLFVILIFLKIKILGFLSNYINS